ncbi:MAG: YeiH family protein [Janthinobacterium lividum]
MPGLLLCLVVTAVAVGLERIEAAAFGATWLEALVLAILVGTAVRTAWRPGPRWARGIAFSAKTLLEIAVLLLGTSISAAMIMAAGPLLIVGIAGIVVVAILASYFIGRALRLPHRMALLVACGNSICGNSAIAAVAPIIGADGEDVAASIAFTAVLGVLVVLGLPLLPVVLHLTELQYGVLAGLTVYAVPQVLAAAAPMGAVAVQMGTLVKLVRVLMLGPVVLCLSLLTRRMRDETDELAPHLTAGDRPKPGKLPLHKMLPWFIVGFLAMAGLRSAGLIPEVLLKPAAVTASTLTIISMAALGLGTDLKTVAGAGPRVIAAVTASLALLLAMSIALIRTLGIA